MCNRFANTASAAEVVEQFAVDDVLSYYDAPRYNIAVYSQVPVITVQDDRRRLELMQWGLLPGFNDTKRYKHLLSNARADTLAQPRSVFKNAFTKRRALVPATGFFEWRSDPANAKAKKTPFHFRTTDRPLFAFAGMWEVWDKGEEPVFSFAIATTEPNSLVSSVHDRMPVLLRAEDEALWLDPHTDAADLLSLLAPYPGELMEGYAVDAAVGNTRFDAPAFVKPLLSGERLEA